MRVNFVNKKTEDPILTGWQPWQLWLGLLHQVSEKLEELETKEFSSEWEWSEHCEESLDELRTCGCFKPFIPDPWWQQIFDYSTLDVIKYKFMDGCTVHFRGANEEYYDEPAKDDDDITPQGWVWRVSESSTHRISELSTVWDVRVKHSVGSWSTKWAWWWWQTVGNRHLFGKTPPVDVAVSISWSSENLRGDRE